MRSPIMPKKLTIQAMQQLAERRGGKCLSDVYINSKSPLLWECAKGHQWTAVPASVQQGRWCPTCAGNTKLTIDDMRRLAECRGGRCLSKEYVNNRTPLLLECGAGHRWETDANHIRRGQWCPTCGHARSAEKQRSSIGEMRKIAHSRGGRCLSEEYVNNRTPLLWECRAGHRWMACADHVKMGEWCPVCAGNSKPSMDDIRRIARERGGRCLSQSYKNGITRMKWECIEGHQWKATWDSIGRGSWCPTCSTGLGERICREYFSQLFQDSFPKSRPKWLVNRDGNQMELDGYCATLGIAFEHQGRHHYSTKTLFIDTKSALSRRQRDDARKRRLCSKRGITLVLVPEIPIVLPLDQVRAFIKKKLSIKGVHIPRAFDTRDVDINRAYRTPDSREMLNELRAIAAEHGGKCLSESYVSAQSKLLWQCAQGHKWQATPNSIRNGTWCLKCEWARRRLPRTLSLPLMQSIAASRGGKCLSDKYVNSSTHLLWQCEEGHQWKAVPYSIRMGRWCPVCGGTLRKTLEEMQSIAASRGGKCLSDKYINANTHLLWQCKEGHEWKATLNHIIRGQWCPVCGRSAGWQRRKAR